MSEQNYLDKCVSQALAQSGGNAASARKILTARAKLDARLLQAMASPHMVGIVSYHVDRILRKAKAGDIPKPRKAKTPLPPPPKNMQQNEFTNALRGAIEDHKGQIFGQEQIAKGSRSKIQASNRHISALRAIANGRKQSH